MPYSLDEVLNDTSGAEPPPSAPTPAISPTPRVSEAPSYDLNAVLNDTSGAKGAAEYPAGESPWSDDAAVITGAGHGLMAQHYSLLSSLHGDNPDLNKGYSLAAEQSRKAQQASHDSMSIAGQQALDAPGITGGGVRGMRYGLEQQAIGLAPWIAAGTVGGLAGPGGAVAATSAYGGYSFAAEASDQLGRTIQDADDAKLRETNPDYDGARHVMPENDSKLWLKNKIETDEGLLGKSALTGMSLGAVGGAELSGLVGGAEKLGLGLAEQAALKATPLTNIAKGAARGAGELGVTGGIQSGITQEAQSKTGLVDEPTLGSMVSEGLRQAVPGLIFGSVGGALHGREGTIRNLASKGGETGSEQGRTDAEARQAEAKPRAQGAGAGEAPPAGGGSIPSNPVDDAAKAAMDAAAGKPKPTPKSKDQQAPPVKQPGVAQPPPPPSQAATEGAQAGDTTEGVRTPQPEAQASAAPVPAPPIPVDPAVLAQQRAEVFDPNHPRDAVIYPKGAQVPDITENKARYVNFKLPNDGRTVVYDHDYGRGQWTKAKIKEAAKDGSLEGKIEAQANKPRAPESVAGAQPAAAEEAPVQGAPAAADAAPEIQPQEPSVEPTPESKPEPELLATNKTGVKLYRDPDPNGKGYLSVAPGKEPVQRGEDTAKMLFPDHFGAEAYTGEKSETEKVREAADTEAQRLKLAREKVATLSAKDEEGREISKPLPEAGKRVFHDVSEEGQARDAAQAKADAEAAARVATEQPAVKPIRAKEDIKGSKDQKRNEAQATANKIAGEIVDRHPPKDIEAKAIDPSKAGGKGARAALMSRVKEMLEDAKGKYEFLASAKHRTVEEARHSNKALILYEAKLLLGRGAKAKTEDYMRFLHNEHELLTGGQKAYDDVMGLRKETGRERAAELSRVTKEAGVEDVDATKGTEQVETADEAHERELTNAQIAREKFLEAKRANEERIAAQKKAHDDEQEELRKEAELAKRALPAEPEIISPARGKVMDEAGGRELKTVGDEAPAKLFEHMSVPEFREYMQGLHDSLPDGSVAKQGAKDQLGNIDRSANWKGSEGEASYPPPDARQNIVDHIRLEHNAEVRRKAEENPWKKVGEALTREKEKPTHESKQETNERQDYERQKKFYEDALKREGLTELQKQQMRSELAKLKVDWMEREHERATPKVTEEGEGYTPVKARTTGFQVEKGKLDRGKWKKEDGPEEMLRHAGWTDKEIEEFKARSTPDQLWDAAINAPIPGSENEELVHLTDAVLDAEASARSEAWAASRKQERAAARPPYGKETVEITGRFGKVNIAPTRISTAEDAINENHDQRRYEKGVPQIMGKLRDLIVKIAGDTKVYYIDSEQMKRITGSASRGAYNYEQGIIVLNVDNMLASTPLHEAYHAAIAVGLRKQPHLRDLMEKLRLEVTRNLPKDMSKEDKRAIAYYLDDHEEFVNGIMTHPLMQSLLKGVKISADLAREIGIPRWRKMTMWEGALGIIRKVLGLGPRDTSAIEAAMSLSEEAMWQDPSASGDLMQAAGRLASAELRGDKWWKQEAASAEREEERARVPDSKGMSSGLRKMGTDAFNDMRINADHWWQTNKLKFMPSSVVESIYGDKLFKDGGKENILSAGVNALEGRHQEFRKLSNADVPFRTRAAEITKKYADRMNDFARLLEISDKFNIHADRDLVPSKAAENVQQQKYHAEAQKLLKSFPEDLQTFYRELGNKNKELARSLGANHIERLLTRFEPPNGLTNKEAIKLALDNNLTDEQKEHYNELGIGGELDKASSLLNSKRAYYTAFREGDHVVVGTHAMPEGGNSVDYSGSKLADNTREFDTRQEADDFQRSTELKATPKTAYYFKDPQGNFVKQLKDPMTGKIVKASSVEYDEKKFQVSLQNEHLEMHTTPARAQRARQEMLANGVDTSEVLDKRKDGNWGRMIGSPATAFERRIRDMNLSPAEEHNMIAASRQIALASQSGNKLSSHWMTKRYVSGADYGSVYEAYRDYSNAVNYHIASSHAQDAINDALERLDNHADANRKGPNAQQISAIANNFKDRLTGGAASVSPKTPWWLHALRVLGFSKYLLTPKWIIQHQMHPFAYTAPQMAGEHGYANAVRYLYQAGKDVGGNLGNIGKGLKSSYEMARAALGVGDEDRRTLGATPLRMVDRIIDGIASKNAREGSAMRQFDQWGLLHSGFDEEVYGAKGWAKLDAVMRQTTNAMEATNRTRSSLGAYRAMFDKLTHAGKSVEDADAQARDYARKIVRDSMGQFSPSNMAPMLRNPYVRSMMQFKQFPMQQNYAMIKNVYHAFKGESPEVKREAVRAIGYQLTSSAVMAGVYGMPLLGLLKGVGLLGSALGVTPAPSQVDDRMYRWLSDNVSPGFGKAIMSGAPSLAGQWAPDLTNMFGYSGDLFYSEPHDNHLGDYLLEQLGGAPYSVIHDTMRGIGDAWDGDLVKGAGEAIPIRLFADPFKGYALATEGVKTAKGMQIMPASPEAGALKMLGLTPQSVNYAYQGHFALQDASKNQPKTMQEQLKEKQRKAKERTVLGVPVSKGNQALVREYENAYQ